MTCLIYGNMDKTPMYFDMVPDNTLDRKGAKTVRVRTTGSEKRHTTVFLTVMTNGDLTPPLIFLKEKGPSSWKPDEVVVEVQEKVRMDQTIMNIYITKIWY